VRPRGLARFEHPSRYGSTTCRKTQLRWAHRWHRHMLYHWAYEKHDNRHGPGTPEKEIPTADTPCILILLVFRSVYITCSYRKKSRLCHTGHNSRFAFLLLSKACECSRLTCCSFRKDLQSQQNTTTHASETAGGHSLSLATPQGTRT
jgi:hypothetical protein